MKETIRILTAQDLSCFGQCSLTVALPVLSALGVETAILPTALLSTHTGGFSGYFVHDLKEDIEPIRKHWVKEGLSFSAVYTGYLGKAEEVDSVLLIAEGDLNKGPLIVDPAFADHGKLYWGFDEAYVEEMRKLSSHADILLPNLSEAYFLLGKEYKDNPSKGEIDSLLDGLIGLGAKQVVLKGIGNTPEETGVIVYDGKKRDTYSHRRIRRDYHGTGDIFASVFVGAFLNGRSAMEGARLACDFVSSAIENTLEDETHGYGVRFEPLLASFAYKNGFSK